MIETYLNEAIIIDTTDPNRVSHWFKVFTITCRILTIQVGLGYILWGTDKI